MKSFEITPSPCWMPPKQPWIRFRSFYLFIVDLGSFLQGGQNMIGDGTIIINRTMIPVHPHIFIYIYNSNPLSPKLRKLAHATQISYSTYLSGNALHKFNTLHKFSALRKGNTYHANIVLHNSPHIVALGYLQGERIPELHRLSWQCLDNTLKLEIGMLNCIPVWERTPRS